MATSTRLMVPLRLIGVAALGLTAFTVRAHACTIVSTELPNGVLAAWASDLPPVPRNVAFVWSLTRAGDTVPTGPVKVADDSTSQPILGRLVKAISQKRAAFIAKPDEPLPPHLEMVSGRISLTTGDYIDEVPPEVPHITESSVRYDDGKDGCDESSCGELTRLEVTLDEPSKDDHAPPQRVAYAVYLEKSAEAARTTTTPVALVSETGAINTTTLLVWLDESWVDSDAFVSVAAIDWAGNESPRTEPRQANSSGSGCAVPGPRRHRPTFAVALAILSGLAWMRRMNRRR